LDKLMKKVKCFLGLAVLAIMCCFSTDVVKAEQNMNGQDLLLKNKEMINEIKELIENIDSRIEVAIIEEIGLMRLTYPSEVDMDCILQNERIAENIEESGILPNIELVMPSLQTIDASAMPEGQLERYNRSRMSNEELFYANAWHVDSITNNGLSLEKATGEGVRIALIDSGIDPNHPILSGKIDLEDAVSFISEDESIVDTNGHGTMVAGIIAQVAPDAKITPYRVISAASGDSAWTIQAIIQAVDDGNDLINMSLGTYKAADIEDELLTIKAFERAIEYAEEKHVLVVASTGNKSLNLDTYYEEEHMKHLPGSLQGVIAVSSNNGDVLASYSNFGSNTRFCAPGGDLVYINDMLDLSEWIYCIYPTTMDNGLSVLGVPQGYTFSYGTSLSAPQITAAIADVIDFYELKTDHKDTALQYLEDTCLDLGEIGYDIKFGYGKIDIHQAIMKE